MSVLGISGLPKPKDAGNVLRSSTKARIGVRLPPTMNPDKAAETIKKILSTDPPFGA